MRKDIEIHINTGDVTFVSNNSFKIREFRWTTNEEGLSRYIYGEIDIPFSISAATIRNDGFYVHIPYTPKYKEFMIRIRRIDESGNLVEYLPNRVNGSIWFTATTGLYGQEQKNIYASQLVTISETDFFVNISGANVNLYSCDQSDFNIVDADRQNGNCLLACMPTNNYRYPTTGVGLSRWINAVNVNATNLAETIQSEFKDDGIAVKNAYYNYSTKKMEMELDASDVE